MKTSKANYKEFRGYVDYWQRELGLFDWNIHFEHRDEDDAYAKTFMSYKGRVATIVLNVDWFDRQVDSRGLKKTALHECLHLVTADLMCEAASRYTQEFDVEKAEEAIVVRLTNLIARLV